MGLNHASADHLRCRYLPAQHVLCRGAPACRTPSEAGGGFHPRSEARAHFGAGGAGRFQRRRSRREPPQTLGGRNAARGRRETQCKSEAEQQAVSVRSITAGGAWLERAYLLPALHRHWASRPAAHSGRDGLRRSSSSRIRLGCGIAAALICTSGSDAIAGSSALRRNFPTPSTSSCAASKPGCRWSTA